MEVDDLELLELVNDYQRRSDEPTFNTLDDIPEALMIDALDEANYIEDEINDYMMVEDISISKLTKIMKRFLIHVSTYWCGMDNTFRAEAESELELDEIADQLAYDNFQSYGCEADIAEEEGYDPDEMEDSDWDKLWETVDESQYYNFTIEEFEGDDEEWEEYGGEIYGKDN